MLSLLDDHKFYLLAEQIFLEHLPEDIRMQIADSDFKDSRALAQRADILLLAKQQSATHVIQRVSLQKKSAQKNDKSHDWCYYHSNFGEQARKCHPPCKYPETIRLVATNSFDDRQTRMQHINTCKMQDAMSQSHCHPQMLYVRDRNSGQTFLIDTGARVSVFPATGADTHSGNSGPQLEAANGTLIRSHRSRNITLSLDGCSFNWTFVIADVTQPLLGADFLHSFDLMVDIKGQRLINTTTFSSVMLNQTTGQYLGIHSVSMDRIYADILAEFPEILTPTFSCSTVRHGVEHFIPTEGPPIHSRARRLPPDKLTTAKQEFKHMEALGIVRRSSSQWSSPLHMVPKQDGDLVGIIDA